MIRRIVLLILASLVMAACSSPPDTVPSTKLVTSSPIPGGSPDVPTPTAIISLLAPPPSPVPSPSPSPAASPVAESPPSGPRFSIVSERSQAAYRARETFVGQAGPADAVGTTKDVSGDLHLTQDGILRGSVLGIKIDLRTLSSGSSRRDSYVRDNTLQTTQFPFAEFRSTAPAGPSDYQAGDEVTFQILGLMTIRGRDRPIIWEARARLEGTTITGSASSRVKLTDFGIAPPRLAVLSVEDEMTWEISIVAQRVP